jgi:hypothetical protein
MALAFSKNDALTTVKTGGMDVALGLRWTHGRLAVEGILKETLLVDGPDFVGGTAPGLLGAIGLSVGL